MRGVAGIAPSKDNYWSTPIQAKTRYGNKTSEPHGRLQSAVLSFSNGPVAPSDMVGGSNRSIILMACDSGGTLLSPDKPATQIDATFTGAASGQLWSTRATVSGAQYGYVFAPALQKNYTIASYDLPSNGSSLVATRHHAVTHEGGALPSSTTPVSGAGLTVTATKSNSERAESLQFEVILLSPKLAGGWSLLGEASKWVSVSPQRFSAVHTSAATAFVQLSGAAGERVEVAWQDPSGKLVSKACVIAGGGGGGGGGGADGSGQRFTMTMKLARSDVALGQYAVSCVAP